MAVNGVKLSTNLIIKVKTGVDAKGNDLFKNVTLRKIKTTAVDADVYEVAGAIGGLIKFPVEAISKQEVSELINQ